MSDTRAGTGKRIELTLRALVLGCLLAAVFTAANTYLGLKVGLTFASAIPAAVLSMSLLRAFRGSTIWENMTVQTVASVGGAMSAIIFVLPGLVMIGWWMNFPFWESVMICILGGVLGVTFSIPLRRTLVVQGGLREDAFSGGFALKAQRCWDYDQVCAQHARRLWLRLDLREPDTLRRVEELLARHRPGATALRLDLLCADAAGSLDFPLAQAVRVDAQLAGALRATPGVTAVKLALARPWG